ncbi:hypothetical protein V6Z11_D08G151800 [Gossypium hirsutum]
MEFQARMMMDLNDQKLSFVCIQEVFDIEEELVERDYARVALASEQLFCFCIMHGYFGRVAYRFIYSKLM